MPSRESGWRKLLPKTGRKLEERGITEPEPTGKELEAVSGTEENRICRRGTPLEQSQIVNSSPIRGFTTHHYRETVR